MLYILQLRSDRIFVYCNSSVIQDDLDDIIRDCQFLYDFTQKYPIESIIETKSISSYDQTNYFVKLYMSMYGIENVRGGSYSNTVLSKEQVEIIMAEMAFNTRITECDIILELYNEYSESSKDKRDEIKESWSKYTALKEEYAGITEHFDYRKLGDELEWLKEKLVLQIVYNMPKPCDRQILKEKFQRYMNIIPYIKRLPLIADSIRLNANEPPFNFRKIFKPFLQKTIDNAEEWPFKDTDANCGIFDYGVDYYFSEYDYDAEGTTPEEFDVFISNPQFIFDDIFVEKRWSQSSTKSADLNGQRFKPTKYILQVFAIIMFYYNYIVNRVTELEFAVEKFAFITDMKFEQFDHTLWSAIYTQFIDKCLISEDYIAANPDIVVNCVNDDGV